MSDLVTAEQARLILDYLADPKQPVHQVPNRKVYELARTVIALHEQLAAAEAARDRALSGWMRALDKWNASMDGRIATLDAKP